MSVFSIYRSHSIPNDIDILSQFPFEGSHQAAYRPILLTFPFYNNKDAQFGAANGNSEMGKIQLFYFSAILSAGNVRIFIGLAHSEMIFTNCALFIAVYFALINGQFTRIKQNTVTNQIKIKNFIVGGEAAELGEFKGVVSGLHL